MRDLLIGLRDKLALERLDGLLASYAVANAEPHGGVDQVSDECEGQGCFHLCALHSYCDTILDCFSNLSYNIRLSLRFKALTYVA